MEFGLDKRQDPSKDSVLRPPNFGFSVTRVLQDGTDTFVKAVHEPEGNEPAWLTTSLIRRGANGLMSVHRQISVRDVPESVLVSAMAAYAVANGDAGNTETSRKQVRGFIEAMAGGRTTGNLDDFVDRTAFARYRSMSGGERERLDELIERRQPRDGVRYHGIDDLVAEGDFAAVFSCFDTGGEHFRACDLFRLEAGKIVEHWDAVEAVAPHTVAHNDEA